MPSPQLAPSPIFAAVTSLLLAAAVGSSGQAPQITVPAPPVTAVPAPNRISINVEVTDKLDRHVSGLQPGDFTLLDNKQPAKVIDFHEVDTRNPADDPVHCLIVLDMINTDFNVVAREREQLGEFLKQGGGHLAHPTSLVVFTEKGLTAETAATRDGNLLQGIINGANSEIRIEGRGAGFWGAADRLQWSLQQIAELVAHEASQPGRKLVFLLSPGWPLLPWAGDETTDKERRSAFSAVVALTNQLRQANMTLYAIDPFELGRTDPFFYQNYLKGVSNVNQAQYGHLALQVLATHSGGLVEITGMDIKGGINHSIRDANTYYTLTFEAPAPDRLNEYHELHLVVDKPGAKVRTTSGYYANVQTP